MKRSDKGAQLSRNVLTRAFRDFLTQLKMEEKTITALMEIYLRTPERQLSCGDDPTEYTKNLANDRGNLKKEIERDEYTLKVFLKLMQLIRPAELEISFKATWHDGFMANNTYQIDLSDVGDFTVTELLTESFNGDITRYKPIVGTVEPTNLTKIENASDKIAANDELTQWKEAG